MEDLDLSEFHDVFFDEAIEHLTNMEALLLDIDMTAADDEQLNAIFRAAHSIKGGAAAFDFKDMTELTHEMETVFDRVRKGSLPLSNELVNVFLASGDTLCAMVAVRKGEGPEVPVADVLALCERLKVFLVDAAPAPDAVADAPVAATTAISKVAAVVPIRSDEDFGFFVDPATLPANAAANVAASVAAATPKAVATRHDEPAAARPAASDASSIRVSVHKVDELINLVGELVITQAMLAQTASNADPIVHEKLLDGLAQLQRNTRDLQESAMSIRMLPMSFVFGRFPRVVRDVAAKLGKDIDLVLVGENTELDKGLIERIVDPLTHLVRNSVDHGIETPAQRVAKGKSPKGTITLSAFHRGGNIMVEVTDDGAGMDRARLLTKARERGMNVSDAMSDQEVFGLIFEAGFSTAEKITDVSGRGVGMDVVRRNIRAMGGSVEIDSALGAGSRISIRLPLTLAILDGMSVGVGNEVFIIPLTHITESLQPSRDALKTIAGHGRVVQVRGDYLPVLVLHEAFNLKEAVTDFDRGIMVVLESEGTKTALFVDELLGQHQVVIKSLETNYRKVHGVSGATIMGDGRVALILDVAGLIDGVEAGRALAA